LQESVNHILEIDDDPTKIVSAMKNNPQIIGESIQHFDKQAALKIMASEIDTNLLNSQENPFEDVIIFRLKSNSNIQSIHEQLEAIDGVSKIYAQDFHLEQVKKNLFRAGFIVLIAAGIFSLLSLALIYTTLQLQLYANRFEIKTMELVGAEDKFIKMPFLKKSVRLANQSAFNASVLLTLVFLSIKYGFTATHDIMDYKWLIISIVLIWLLGIIFLWASNNYLIKKYLTSKLNEMYN